MAKKLNWRLQNSLSEPNRWRYRGCVRFVIQSVVATDFKVSESWFYCNNLLIRWCEVGSNMPKNTDTFAQLSVVFIIIQEIRPTAKWIHRLLHCTWQVWVFVSAEQRFIIQWLASRRAAYPPSLKLAPAILVPSCHTPYCRGMTEILLSCWTAEINIVCFPEGIKKDTRESYCIWH